MLKEKKRCIYCDKKVKLNSPFCNKCGRDIRCMWETDEPDESAVVQEPLFCPNPVCHAPYTDGEVWCIQCRNDFGRFPPIPKSKFGDTGAVPTERVFCPRCGKQYDDPHERFCECGCDFRIEPMVASSQRVSFPEQPAAQINKRIFCAECRSMAVRNEGDVCDSCKQRKRQSGQQFMCPECRRTPVSRAGQLCSECSRNQPMRGIGEGFHVVE